jgi:hypothetical protein
MANLEGLNPDFRARLMALVGASGGRITIGSAFRSVEEQAGLFKKAVDKYGSENAARKWAAPPGKSNHNKGFAADLGGDLALAARLAPQFGLAFPMAHEPWHVEPLGFRGSPSSYTLPPDADHDAYDFNDEMSLPPQASNPVAEFAQLLNGAGLSMDSATDIEQLEQIATGVQ